MTSLCPASAGSGGENEPRVPRRAVAVESGPGGRRRGARQRLQAAMATNDSGISLCKVTSLLSVLVVIVFLSMYFHILLA